MRIYNDIIKKHNDILFGGKTMFSATTIVAVRRNGQTAIGGDGQVTFGENTIMKSTAQKVKTVYSGKVAVGFAGSVADAFELSEKFEAKLEQYSGCLLYTSRCV